MRMRVFRNLVAISMASLLVMNVAPIGLAHAKIVTTNQVIEQSDPSDNRTQVLNFLMRDDVQQHMIRLGVDPDEAKNRVASLSDEEIQQIAGRLDELPAGEGLGVIVGAILIIFLVLLITDLAGVTDVFPFVKKKAASSSGSANTDSADGWVNPQ